MTKPQKNTPQLTPQILVIDGTAKVSSLQVAQHFKKQHKDVLRSIQNIECSEEFNQRNFAPVEYLDQKGESRPSYHLTKDGFIFLVMGFTGKEAARWKEAYIKAFNQMEQRLRHIDYYTPTALGALLGLNAMHINLLLAQRGFQSYTDRWEATDKGLPYAVCVINTIQHQWLCQLRWRIDILDFLDLTPPFLNSSSTAQNQVVP